MKEIDLQTWPRRDQYELYRACADPFFEISARVQVGDVVARSKAAGWSVFTVLVAALTESLNSPAPSGEAGFRQRLRGEGVVEHDRVHPSWVVLGEDGRMGFARGRLAPGLEAQLRSIVDTTRGARTTPVLAEAHGRDDLFYVSSLAPLDLVAVRAERSGLPDDSVPRFYWGRVQQGALVLTVCAHHCFVDGMAVARLVERFRAAIALPLPRAWI